MSVAKSLWIAGLILVPGFAWAIVVDNQEHDGTVHDWAWAVNEVNTGGAAVITFDLPDAAITNGNAVFQRPFSIDGENAGGTNVVLGAVTLQADGCTIQNVGRLSVYCPDTGGHFFLGNLQIDDVSGSASNLFFCGNQLGNVVAGSNCTFSSNAVVGPIAAGAAADFHDNVLAGGTIAVGAGSSVVSNAVPVGQVGTIRLDSDCEARECHFVALELAGDQSTVEDCTLWNGCEISGNNNFLRDCAVAQGAGVVVAGTGNVVRDCAVSNVFNGIRVEPAAAYTTIRGCQIHDTAGDGIRIEGDHCQVGGTVPGEGNRIYSNASNGVLIVGVEHVFLEGNEIGIPDGVSPTGLGNAGSGVLIQDAADVRVGLVEAGGPNRVRFNGGGGIRVLAADDQDHDVRILNNVIRQNVGFGIQVAGGRDVEIYANYVGTDATDVSGEGNLGPGIHIQASPEIKIGGPLPAAKNVISGNQGHGIHFEGSAAGDFEGGVVQGNHIGATRTGDGPLPNAGSGVMLARTRGVQIGGVEPGEGNLVSGNDDAGITIAENEWLQAGGNLIQGNYIGTGPNGTGAVPNVAGIYVSGVSNVIGGVITNARNIVSGNIYDGIVLAVDSSSSLYNTAYNQILGNYVGVDATGATALPNGADGIAVRAEGSHAGDCEGNEIGGTNGPGHLARNVISGNAGHGISFALGQTNNWIDGNYIGMAADGLSAVGNGLHGIQLGATNHVGSPSVGTREGNVVSGNGFDGIFAYGSQARIQNNLIGPNAARTGHLPNGGNGITLSTGSWKVVVGGARDAGGNVIVGNAGHGIVENGQENTIAGNWIGMSPVPGDNLGPNAGAYGIQVLSGMGATVGGEGVAGNVIDAEVGIRVEAMSFGAPGILGNIIGFDPDTDRVSTNLQVGIEACGVAAPRIGGTNQASGNLIGAARECGIRLAGCTNGTVTFSRIGCATNAGGVVTNAGHGIVLSNCSGVALGEIFSQAATNHVAGSQTGIWMQDCSECWAHHVRVGFAPDGTVLGNRGDGVRVDGGYYNRAGDYTEDDCSVIGGNAGVGIRVTGADRFEMYGIRIGTDPTGVAAVPNGQGGVLAVDCTNALLGQTAYPNTISGNLRFGLRIEGAGSRLNRVAGNRIGLAGNGADALPNAGDGVQIEDAPSNLVSLCFIWHNASNGIRILGDAAVGNEITRNSIYSNGVRGICLGAGGAANDLQDPDAGPNGLQNFPVVTNAYRGSTVIGGTFNGKPDRDYRVEYYSSWGVNASGFAEGQNYLEGEWFTTDEDGNYVLDGWAEQTTPTGMIITAVATDRETGDTSEFTRTSPYVEVQPAPNSRFPEIPDFYLEMYPLMAAGYGEGSDYDGDGVFDLDEYRAYTDPEDPDDFFQVRIEPASVWIPDSSVGRQYVVERATNQADDAEWTPLGPATTGNETNLDFTIGFGAERPKAFYRGRAQIP